MIDIFDLYQRFCSQVNTSQNGFVRPQTDFEKEANNINMDIWNRYTSMAQKTAEIDDYLAPFTSSVNIITVKTGAFAIAETPDNYSRFSSARVLITGDKCYPNRSVNNGNSICKGKIIPMEDIIAKQQAEEAFWDNVEFYPVTKIEDERWGAATSHLTKRPTLKKAIMRQTDNGFEIAPRRLSVLVLTYYTEPPYVPFPYTLTPANLQTGSGDQIIYKPTSGSSFLWDITLINEFLDRLRDYYFGYTRDQAGNSINNSQKTKAA